MATNNRDTSHSRVREEFCETTKQPIEAWRIFKIIAEFVNGFEKIEQYDLAVTFFGSARCHFGDKIYQAATDLSGKLSREGFTIITGGGSGVMEAANRGAYEAKGNSVGLNIDLEQEQSPNAYLTDSIGFNYFFTRKVMLTFASEAYVFFPGGFGTLDEFFELVMLIQTKKIKPIPIVLFGRDYWEPLLSWIERDLCHKYQAISKKDMDIYHLVDTVEEAEVYILKSVTR